MADEREDVSLSIRAKDAGATRVVNALIRALRQLGIARDESVRLAKNEADSLREQARVAELTARQRVAQLAEVRRAYRENIDAARQAGQAEVEAAQARLRASREGIGELKEQNRQRIQAARDALTAARQNATAQIEETRRAVAASIRAKTQEIRAEQERSRRAIESRRAETEALQARNREQRRSEREALRTLRSQVVASKQRVDLDPKNEVAIAQLNAARERLRIQKEEVANQRAARAEEIASARAQLAQLKNVARERTQLARQSITEAREAGQRRIQAATESGRAEVTAARATIRTRLQEARDALGAARQIVSADQRKVISARQAAAQTVNAARASGQAAILAARQAAAAARTQAVALSRAASQAVRHAQSLARAAIVSARGHAQQRQAALGLASAYGALRNRVLQLVAAYGGFRVISGFVAEGLKFNQLIETSTLGIGSLITATSVLTDSQGRQLSGTEALATAQGLAADQIAKLRIENIRTAATIEQLVDSFQQATASGLAAGLTLDQVRKFTVQIAQAAGAIGLPFDQLNQESRSILDATIDRNSRIAKILGLTNAEVRLAKEQNRLAEFLNEKMAAFTVAGEESIKTWAGVKSNIKDAVQLFAGLSTEPLFNRLRDAGLAALKQIFDIDSAEIQSSFRGLISGFRTVFDEVGHLLVRAITNAVEGARALSEWFDRNKVAVQDTVLAIGLLVRNVAGLVIDVIGIATGFAAAKTASGGIVDVVRTINGVVTAIRENIEFIETAIIAFITGKLLMLAFTNPILLAVGLVGLLIGRLIAARDAGRDIAKENLRRLETYGRESAEAAGLAFQYEAIAASLKDTALSAEEVRQKKVQLKTIIEKLSRLGSDYAEVLSHETDNLEANAAAIRKVTQARIDELKIRLGLAQIRKEELSAQAKALGFEPGFDPSKLAGDQLDVYLRNKEAVAAINEEWGTVNATINTVLDSSIQLLDAVTKARQATAETDVAGNKPGGGGSKTDKSLDDEVQAARGRLAAKKAEVKALTEEEKRKFEAFEISARQYYARVRDLQLDQLMAEEALRQAELRLAQRRGDQGQIQQFTAQAEIINSRRLEIHEEYNAAIEKADRESVDRRRRYEHEVLSSGNEAQQVQARARELAEKYHDDFMTALAEQDWTTVFNIARLIQIGTADISFDQIGDAFEREQDRLERRLSEIQVLVDAGLLSQLAAQRQIAKVYRDSEGNVVGLIDRLDALREVMGDDPDFIAFLDEVKEKLREIRQGADIASDGFYKLKQGARDAAESGLADFLFNLGDATKTVGDAFREFASSVIDSIRRIAAEIVANQIITSLLQGFGGAPTGKATGGPVTRATGGPVPGFSPHSRADNVPIMATAGEWVHQVPSVRYYGERIHRAINEMRIPKEDLEAVMRGVRMPPVLTRQTSRSYALGGAIAAVTQARDVSPARESVDVSGTIMVGVDEAGMLRVMTKGLGKKIVLGHVSSSPRLFRRAMDAKGN